MTKASIRKHSGHCLKLDTQYIIEANNMLPSDKTVVVSVSNMSFVVFSFWLQMRMPENHYPSTRCSASHVEVSYLINRNAASPSAQSDKSLCSSVALSVAIQRGRQAGSTEAHLILSIRAHRLHHLHPPVWCKGRPLFQGT